MALYGAAAVVVLVLGPDEVAGHLGVNGSVNRRDPTALFVLGLSITLAGVVALFVAIPTIVRRAPIRFINVPHRDQWDTPKNRAVLAVRLGGDMLVIAAATVLLFIGVLVVSTLGGLGVDLNGGETLLLIAGYLVTIAFVVIPGVAGARYTPPSA